MVHFKLFTQHNILQVFFLNVQLYTNAQPYEFSPWELEFCKKFAWACKPFFAFWTTKLSRLERGFVPMLHELCARPGTVQNLFVSYLCQFPTWMNPKWREFTYLSVCVCFWPFYTRFSDDSTMGAKNVIMTSSKKKREPLSALFLKQPVLRQIIKKGCVRFNIYLFYLLLNFYVLISIFLI